MATYGFKFGVATTPNQHNHHCNIHKDARVNPWKRVFPRNLLYLPVVVRLASALSLEVSLCGEILQTEDEMAA